LPKLYGRLRRAEARPDRAPKRRHKALDDLHHVEEATGHFVERQLLTYLRDSRNWNGRPVALRRITTSTNRIQIELEFNAPPTPFAGLGFEDRAGWLTAWVEPLDGLINLDPPGRLAFEAALGGFFTRAGVQLVVSWLRAAVGPWAYDIQDAGLVVWPGPGQDVEVTYDLDQTPWMVPQVRGWAPASVFPTLTAERVRFDAKPILWSRWVALWGADQERRELPGLPLGVLPVLPERPRPAGP
jgi:hypothetical protein